MKQFNILYTTAANTICDAIQINGYLCFNLYIFFIGYVIYQLLAIKYMDNGYTYKITYIVCIDKKKLGQ